MLVVYRYIWYVGSTEVFKLVSSIEVSRLVSSMEVNLAQGSK